MGKPKDDPRYYIKHCVLSFFSQIENVRKNFFEKN